MAVKVTTGVARASYVNITEPKSINGSKPKYSSSLIIPKSDKATIKLIEDAIEQAIQEGVGKFGGKIPPRGSLKLPLRDGDAERDDEDYAGAYFINANSTFQPGVVDREGNITDASIIYSGCYVRACISFYAFNTNGNRGIAAGLQALQFIRDGKPLGGRVNAAEEFGAFHEDAENDDLFT